MASVAAPCPAPPGFRKPRWEVADVFGRYGQAYRQSRPLPVLHLKIMRAIELCRTEALGGHLARCTHCGFEKPAYNSCRNRHCPKCQALSKARWLEARRAELLPVGYFHVVFTLPHELNALVLCNKAVLLAHLFAAVGQTLQAFGENNLGGKLGFLAILHTWDQKLNAHFHLHCLVPAGVLTDDGERFIAARETFLFPVKALGQVFRGKFLHLLREARNSKQLIYPGQAAQFKTKAGFSELVEDLQSKPWIVYSKPPFGGPEKVLDYLGRYTHRVAISNSRIRAVGEHGVTFAYRDRSDGDKSKIMTLAAEEFIRRFLLHSLPPAFVRIRHFGFLANRAKKVDLARCRELLGLSAQPPPVELKSDEVLMQELTGADPSVCPSCQQGQMRIVAELPVIAPGRLGQREHARLDSS